MVFNDLFLLGFRLSLCGCWLGLCVTWFGGPWFGLLRFFIAFEGVRFPLLLFDWFCRLEWVLAFFLVHLDLV